jgi:hypothetical protein
MAVSNTPFVGIDEIVVQADAVTKLLVLDPTLAYLKAAGEDSLATFPDGSVLFRGGLGLGVFEKHIRSQEDLILQLTGAGLCRSLAGFPRFTYALLYTADYQSVLGEDSFKAGVAATASACPGEYTLDRLLVTVASKGVLSKRNKEILTSVVFSWADSVSEVGVFSEGPARLVNSEARFQGRLCQFRVDMSRSGQRTLNWLTLCLLRFGHQIHPLTGVAFDESEFIDVIFGTAKGQEYMLPIRPLS